MGPDLSPNCLLRLSANDTSRRRDELRAMTLYDISSPKINIKYESHFILYLCIASSKQIVQTDLCEKSPPFRPLRGRDHLIY